MVDCGPKAIYVTLNIGLTCNSVLGFWLLYHLDSFFIAFFLLICLYPIVGVTSYSGNGVTRIRLNIRVGVRVWIAFIIISCLSLKEVILSPFLSTASY